MTSNAINHRARLISGHVEWMANLKEKCDLHGLTFMFDFSRAEAPTLHQMKRIIHRYYSTVLTRMFRRVGKMDLHELPLLVAFPESPSSKQQAIGGSDSWGLHYHGVLAIPRSQRTRAAFAEIKDVAEAHIKLHEMALLRVDLTPVRDMKKFSSYIWKQRAGDGWHKLSEFDVILPYLSEEITSDRIEMRRPYLKPVRTDWRGCAKVTKTFRRFRASSPASRSGFPADVENLQARDACGLQSNFSQSRKIAKKIEKSRPAIRLMGNRRCAFPRTRMKR